MFMISIMLIGVLFVTFVMWILWFRDTGLTYPMFWYLILSKIVDFVMWPIRLLLSFFGLRSTSQSEIPIITSEPIHNEPDCPQCKCECNCPKCLNDVDQSKPYINEIRYLKHMVKLLGKISLRENEISQLYQEIYDPSEGITPDVTRLGDEYKFIKDQIKQDPQEFDYFKRYFTALSEVPSS